MKSTQAYPFPAKSPIIALPWGSEWQYIMRERSSYRNIISDGTEAAELEGRLA